MSHKATASIKVCDLDAVKATLEALGVKMIYENARWYGWRNSYHQDVDLLVKETGMRYGVGFRQKEDGTLEIVSESMAYPTTVEFIQSFKRTYQEKMAWKQLESFGYIVERLPDGTCRARSTARTRSLLDLRNKRQSKGKAQEQVRVGRY